MSASVIQSAQTYLAHGPGARIFAVTWATLVAGAAWYLGYLATSEISPFRLAVIVLALAAIPVIMVHAALLPPLFMGMLWARVSDVAVAVHGVPSLATPVAAGLLVFSLVKKILSGQKLGVHTFGDLALALPYAAVVTLSPLWSAAPARALNVATILLKDLVIFWMFADAMRNRRALQRAAQIVVLAAAAISLPSLHQYVTGNFESRYGGFADSTILNIVGDFDSYRLGGPFNSPNYFALALVVTVPIGVALLRTSVTLYERLVLGGALLTICLTTLLTFSRGGSVLLALLLALSLRRTRITVPRILLGIALLGAVVLVTPTRVWDRLGTLLEPIIGRTDDRSIVDDSVDLRIGAQVTAIEMFIANPFLGVGAGNFPALYQEYSRWLGLRTRSAEYTPHNLYLEILAESGVVGMITFLVTAAVPLLALQRARRHWRADTRGGRDHLELSYGLELALVGWLIAGLFEQGAFPRYYWMLLALVIGAAHVTDLDSVPKDAIAHQQVGEARSLGGQPNAIRQDATLRV